MPMHHHDESAAPSWTWTTDANAFFGYNYQDRKVTNLSAWESQNWFMLDGQRPVGGGRLTLDAMTSLEPFTFHKMGSPQVFQTGEEYHGVPLIDYQHPHDLFMQLGGRYRVPRSGIGYTIAAYLVGAPALGPTPFMHRASGRDNPEAPLIHHFTDSTHITFGVVTAGIDAHGFAVEASLFKGEEPDDDRLDIDRPRLDSWSARASWRHGPWYAQLSGGRLHRPEAFEPFDITRLTASVEFDGTIRARPVAATLLWGENREAAGILDGYLLEWDVRADPHGWFYARAESAAKDILSLGGADPLAFAEFHPISHVQALTLGYIHDVVARRWGRVGLGGDATAYHVPDNLLPAYGSPHSFHFFVRYRPAHATSPAHMH